jgi:hypothetical protein
VAHLYLYLFASTNNYLNSLEFTLRSDFGFILARQNNTPIGKAVVNTASTGTAKTAAVQHPDHHQHHNSIIIGAAADRILDFWRSSGSDFGFILARRNNTPIGKAVVNTASTGTAKTAAVQHPDHHLHQYSNIIGAAADRILDFWRSSGLDFGFILASQNNTSSPAETIHRIRTIIGTTIATSSAQQRIRFWIFGAAADPISDSSSPAKTIHPCPPKQYIHRQSRCQYSIHGHVQNGSCAASGPSSAP